MAPRDWLYRYSRPRSTHQVRARASKQCLSPFARRINHSRYPRKCSHQPVSTNGPQLDLTSPSIPTGRPNPLSPCSDVNCILYIISNLFSFLSPVPSVFFRNALLRWPSLHLAAPSQNQTLPQTSYASFDRTGYSAKTTPNSHSRTTQHQHGH